MRAVSSLVFVALVLAMPAFADLCSSVPGNIVANCGFENGVYSSTIAGNTNGSVPNSWTANAGYDLEPSFNHTGTAQLASVDYTPVNSGTFALSIGNFDFEAVPALSQTLVDLSGAVYSGNIFVSYGGAGAADAGAYFQVLINGTPVLSLNDTAPGTYTEYGFNFVGTGSDVLTLQGNTNPSEWYADDVSAATAATPEPASILLLATIAGLCAASFLKRRRTLRASV
jgi:hypothetical protein